MLETEKTDNEVSISIPNQKVQQLQNNIHDKTALSELLTTVKPRATFSMGGFSSELASSFTTTDYQGVITEIDIESGYCKWENIMGDKMPVMNIDCITLHQKL